MKNMYIVCALHSCTKKSKFFYVYKKLIYEHFYGRMKCFMPFVSQWLVLVMAVPPWCTSDSAILESNFAFLQRATSLNAHLVFFWSDHFLKPVCTQDIFADSFNCQKPAAYVLKWHFCQHRNQPLVVLCEARQQDKPRDGQAAREAAQSGPRTGWGQAVCEISVGRAGKDG